jgi:hypothetical protein
MGATRACGLRPRAGRRASRGMLKILRVRRRTSLYIDRSSYRSYTIYMTRYTIALSCGGAAAGGRCGRLGPGHTSIVVSSRRVTDPPPPARRRRAAGTARTVARTGAAVGPVGRTASGTHGPRAADRRADRSPLRPSDWPRCSRAFVGHAARRGRADALAPLQVTG